MIRDNNYVFIRYKVLKYMGDILNIIGMGALVLSNLGMIMDAIDNASGMFIVGLFSLFFSALVFTLLCYRQIIVILQRRGFNVEFRLPKRQASDGN